jgi:uncharacterized membrane protein
MEILIVGLVVLLTAGTWLFYRVLSSLQVQK